MQGNWKRIAICAACGIVVLAVICCIPAIQNVNPSSFFSISNEFVTSGDFGYSRVTLPSTLYSISGSGSGLTGSRRRREKRKRSRPKKYKNMLSGNDHVSIVEPFRLSHTFVSSYSATISSVSSPVSAEARKPMGVSIAVDLTAKDYFYLTVKSYDGKTAIRIGFGSRFRLLYTQSPSPIPSLLRRP